MFSRSSRRRFTTRRASVSLRARFVVPPDCLDPRIHHNNLVQSILAKIEANAADSAAALMLDARGFIAETNATHGFIVYRGEVLTSHTVACPEGITRATVLEICRANGVDYEEKNLSLTGGYRADEMFCTGTLGELAPVVKVDGRTIGDGARGPVMLRLTEPEGTLVCG